MIFFCPYNPHPPHPDKPEAVPPQRTDFGPFESVSGPFGSISGPLGGVGVGSGRGASVREKNVSRLKFAGNCSGRVRVCIHIRSRKAATAVLSHPGTQMLSFDAARSLLVGQSLDAQFGAKLV